MPDNLLIFITVFLIVISIAMIVWWARTLRKKPHFKRYTFGMFAAFFLLQTGFFYGFNTYTLRTSIVEIADPRIRDDVVIVQLTDLHGSEFGRGNSRLLSRIDRAEPDIVVVTGDMWTRGADDEEQGVEVALRLLRDLGDKYPVFVVDGGHDGYIRQAIERGGINVTFLDYETAEFTVGQTAIAVHGVPNSFFTSSDSLDSGALDGKFDIDDSVYNLLIAHEPRLRAYSGLGVDLALCGHTHGGIVRFPIIGTIYHRDTFGNVWFPELRGLRHLHGVYEDDGTSLFISAGLGLHPAPVRLFNRPEVAVIRLTAA
jgi:hypothetical protein